MENIVTITLLTLTLFGNIEMTTFEIPNTRENYNGMDGISRKDSNLLVCSNWYDINVKISVKKNPNQERIITNIDGMVKKLLVTFAEDMNHDEKIYR